MVVIEEQVIEIDGLRINFARTGYGSHNVLCLPGAIGCWATDFARVLDAYDHDKFTLVCWDPPGYGKSRPPDREFTIEANKRDATIAHKLMQGLNLAPYSILGWSDGGITALHIAHQNRHNKSIRKLIIWGSSSYITADQMEIYKNVTDINKWSEKNRKPYLDIYGLEYMSWAWKSHFDERAKLYRENDGNKCREILPDIPQPVLVVHGTNDIYVPNEHPKYFQKQLKQCRVVYKDFGSHNLHLEHFDWFKEKVEDFLFT